LTCTICEIRRPRRHCPGVRGEICSICCGTEREVTVHCPLDCEHLQEARLHDKTPELDPANVPNHDIRVSEQFVRDREDLLMFLSRALLGAALETSAIDFDVREGLASLIKTYKTLESGLYYESLPPNPIAGAIHQRLRQAVEEFRREEHQRTGVHSVRDADALGLFVFLQQLELAHNNGRKLGRAFLDFVRSFFPAAAQAPPLIVP